MVWYGMAWHGMVWYGKFALFLLKKNIPNPDIYQLINAYQMIDPLTSAIWGTSQSPSFMYIYIQREREINNQISILIQD